MGMFFTWHSSEHGFHLDVKWEPQDEIHGADNTVDCRQWGAKNDPNDTASAVSYVVAFSFVSISVYPDFLLGK